MRLLSKLSTLIGAIVRGTAPRDRRAPPPEGPDAPGPDAPPTSEGTRAGEGTLDQGRVADLLERRLDAPASADQQRSKGG